MSYIQRRVILSEAVNRLIHSNKSVITASDITKLINKDLNMNYKQFEIDDILWNESYIPDLDISMQQKLYGE